jgi:flagellar motility protein MotE (MotC chaperone)
MRLRLLPVLIITALIALTARVGDLWQGLGSMAQAQTASPAETPATKTPATKTTATGQSKRGAQTSTRGPKDGEADYSDDPMPAEVDSLRVLEMPADPFSMTDEEIDLLQALAERRRELDLRAHELEQREILLRAVEQRIEEKAGGLRALLKQQENQTEDQYTSLVKIYESMKPKDAARIFEEMDLAVLMPVVERMKERKTAPILAKMSPSKATAITTQLAQRRKAPTENTGKR